MTKMELVAPAGSLEKLKVALLYGADAVFFGGKSYGLRAFSGNLTESEIFEATTFAHNLNRKLYATVNIIPHNDDLKGLPQYLELLDSAGVDAVIVSDPGVFQLVRSLVPKMPIHISTQANTTNWAAARFWQQQGAKRVVLARELSLSEIHEIHEQTNLELEAFVHGAMCISYSGRCLLSNYFTSRDANRGQCAQACRWRYALMEETRPGQYFPIVEDERGTYIFNSRDLCLLPYLPELAAAGVNSLKIEGRMKSIHYVATVVKVYREAIDVYSLDPNQFMVEQKWLDELEKASHRAYTSGFAVSKSGEADQIYEDRSYSQTYDFIGLVHDYDKTTKLALVEQRNNMRVGEVIEFMQPGCNSFQQTIAAMTDIDKNPITVAPHAQQLVWMPVNEPVVPFAMLRRKVNNDV